MIEAVPTLDTIQDSPPPYVATNLHFVQLGSKNES